MRLGLVADIHANAVVLDAVLDAMPPVDRLVCAGDIVGYGPHPRECVARLREREAVSIRGNHDRAVTTGASFSNGMAAAGAEYAMRELDEKEMEWLASLPETRELEGVRVAHGHPNDPDRYVYPALFAPGLLDGSRALVLGHTHVQGHETFGEGVVANPGSVGQPRDGDPRAAFAILDTETLAVEAHRVEYGIEAVIADVRAAGLPESIGTRLKKGR